MTKNSIYPELPRIEVEALGIRTNCYVAGDEGKPAVILLHGMSTSADSFRELMSLLADDFRLIAPDIPGFGYSENTNPYTMEHLIEWLADLVETLELPSAHLLGHSFGGVLAMGQALSYPEKYDRLVLVAPAVLVASQYPDWLKKAGKNLRLVEAGIVFSRVLLERQIRVPFFDASSMDETVWERRRTDYANSRASAAAMNAVAFYDVRPRLPEIKQPTFIIWGEDDPVVPHEHAEKIDKYIADSQIYKVSTCGHIPMLEREQEVAGIIREFLQ
ncbi:MAG: alpha/beta hydrolase [Candidatus Promineifilaceae bacterium]